MRGLPLALMVSAALLAGADDNSPRSFGRPEMVSMPAQRSVTVQPGKTVTTKVHFTIAQGYHVNSNKPNSDLLIPTTVKIQSTPQFVVSKLTYPAGEEFALKFAPEEKLSVYAGDVAVQAAIKASSKAKVGSYTLTGELHYQACNDRSCFPPKTLPLEIAVTVKK